MDSECWGIRGDYRCVERASRRTLAWGQEDSHEIFSFWRSSVPAGVAADLPAPCCCCTAEAVVQEAAADFHLPSLLFLFLVRCSLSLSLSLALSSVSHSPRSGCFISNYRTCRGWRTKCYLHCCEDRWATYCSFCSPSLFFSSSISLFLLLLLLPLLLPAVMSTIFFLVLPLYVPSHCSFQCSWPSRASPSRSRQVNRWSRDTLGLAMYLLFQKQPPRTSQLAVSKHIFLRLPVVFSSKYFLHFLYTSEGSLRVEWKWKEMRTFYIEEKLYL